MNIFNITRYTLSSFRPRFSHLNVSRFHSSPNVCTSKPPVRIGCASGFWGDTAVAPLQLIKHGNIKYLVLDYLSEVTMSLLSNVKNKNPKYGYIPDFVQTVITPHIREIKKRGIKVIANAGGMNLPECARAVSKAAEAAGIEKGALRVALVSGDDLLPRVKELRSHSPPLVDLDSGTPFPEKDFTSMNAYLGAGPIARALDLGADIVITGRCVDSALALAPLVHEFRWPLEGDPAGEGGAGARNFNRLAMGSLAGHLIECGAQCTGGIFTDWHLVPQFENIGFPVVECSENGEFVLTKPPGTGGLVSRATAAEQLVYEIGDPRRYYLPDVVADFSKVRFEEVGEHRVKVSGAQGLAPTSDYKVCSTYNNGFRMISIAFVGGRNAPEKAIKTGEAILKRVRGMMKMFGMPDFTALNMHVVGTEQIYGKEFRNPNMKPREVALFFGAKHDSEMPLQLFAREIAPSGTGMAPGLMFLAGGRPRPAPVLTLYSYLLPKRELGSIEIAINGEKVAHYSEPAIAYSHSKLPLSKDENALEQQVLSDAERTVASTASEAQVEVPLVRLAYTRSGDKGNMGNVGVIARKAEYYPYLLCALTPKTVGYYFRHLIEPTEKAEQLVERYLLPGVSGMNFLLRNSLGGGGVSSLRPDPQGKAYGQMLADMRIQVPRSVASTLGPE